MHHVKAAARGEAWGESTNPFARHNRAGFKKTSLQTRAEEGRSLYKTQTAPSPSRPEFDELNQAHPQHLPQTTTNARSRRIDEFFTSGEKAELTTSPRNSQDLRTLRDPRAHPDEMQSDSTDHTLTQHMPAAHEKSTTGFQPSTNAPNEDKKRHGLKGLFHKKDKSSDDNNNNNNDHNNGKDKSEAQHFTFWSQIKATIFGSWINVLLIFSPIGIAVHFAKINPIAVFVINFIAIIPLAAMLSYATEEIALRTGEVIGGLLNATFGNAVELIVSVIALFQNQFLIVQTSLLGSMLSNLLLVMGMCFFFGGINRIEQAFNVTVAQTASSLLFLAVSSLIIPTTFEAWALNTTDKTVSNQPLAPGVLELSRGTSVILLLIYCCYLFFQLKSHVQIYTKASEKNKSRFTPEQKQKWKSRAGITKIKAVAHRRESHTPHDMPPSSLDTDSSDKDDNYEEEEKETPALSLWVAIFTLAASTVLVALNAEFLVDSINEVTCTGAISKTFVGLILLPIVGNAAEHATAVTVAIKDKMDLAIGVAVGSSMQIALLVLPLVVVIGWIAGKDGMTLYFDGFQLAMLFVAILLVNYLIQDGKSHWLEGILLMMLYIIIATAAWFYPADAAASDCPAKH